MNNSRDPANLTYLPRWISPAIATAAAEHPITVLTGARQTGKSTLLLNAEPFRHWRYYTLDDYDVLEQIERDPAALWVGAHEVVLDEVQKAPSLLPAVKQAVDRRPGQVRFVLSGSANLLLMRQVSESLAGRAVYFDLAPMSFGEVHGRPPPAWLSRWLDGQAPSDLPQPTPPPTPWAILLRGYMPALLSLEHADAWVRWWEGYVATYLERDLRQISQIASLVDFRRVMEILALRNGQILNQSEVARDANLSQPTAHRYLNLLESTHLMLRVPAYAASRTKRLIKSPKVHWVDPGLAAYLAGYFDEQSVAQAREAGALFESMVLNHLRILAQLMTPRGRLYYWRTAGGVEVDFVLEHGRRLIGIEAKLTGAPRFGDADGLRAFLQEHPSAVGGVLVHSGTEIKWLDRQIIALPWTALGEGA